ncbi:MAG: hypothetical protein AB2A00_07220 [Myxococcota bacterium]
MRWMLVLSLLVLGCGSAEPGTSRGAISGRVILVDAPGLNDVSRVNVLLQGANLTTVPNDDGTFAFADLHEGNYELAVGYQGLGATGSPYRRAHRSVSVKAGQTVNVGGIALEVGSGRVSGIVRGVDGGLVARVILSPTPDAIIETNTSVGGAFVFTEISVGTYQLRVDLSGHALPSTATCPIPVVVSSDEEEVVVPPLDIVPFTFAFSTSTPDVSVDGSTWSFTTDDITVLVASGTAALGRYWFGVAETPDYEPFQPGGYRFQNLPEGEHVLHFQFTDVCNVDSPVFTLTLVRDTTPPTLSAVTLNNDDATTSNATMSLEVTAQDATQMRVHLCATQDAAGQPLTCPDTVEDMAWTSYQSRQAVTFDSSPGVKTVTVQVRDDAGNLSGVLQDSITLQ